MAAGTVRPVLGALSARGAASVRSVLSTRGGGAMERAAEGDEAGCPDECVFHPLGHLERGRKRSDIVASVREFSSTIILDVIESVSDYQYCNLDFS